MDEKDNIEDIGLGDEHVLKRHGKKVLPEGDYSFLVKDCEISSVVTDENKSYRVAAVTMRFDSDDGKSYNTVKARFRFIPESDIRSGSFLRSIGLGDTNGDATLGDFANCVGLNGRAHIVVKEFKNESGDIVRYNSVKTFYDETDDASSTETDREDEDGDVSDTDSEYAEDTAE